MPQHIFDKLDLPISGSGGTSSVSFVNNPKSVAAQFSALVGYTKGQLVYYDNALYRFTADHAAGAWNSGHVTAVTVAGELKAAQEEVADLKEDLTPLYVYKGLPCPPTFVGNNNTAITNNGDGTYTVGTTDYGVTTFGIAITLTPGDYYLYGVPNGIAFLTTVYTVSTAYANKIFENTTNGLKKYHTDYTITLYIGFKISSIPSESFTITPCLYEYIPRVQVIEDTVPPQLESLKSGYVGTNDYYGGIIASESYVDNDDWTDGGYFGSATGNIIEAEGYSYQYARLQKAGQYTTYRSSSFGSQQYSLPLFDDGKNFVKSVVCTTYTTDTALVHFTITDADFSDGVRYVGLSTITDTDITLSFGAKYLSAANYPRPDWTIRHALYADKSILGDDIISLNANYFDADTATWNTGYILPSDGSIAVNDSYRFAYVPLRGAGTYIMLVPSGTFGSNAHYMPLYDINKKWVKTLTPDSYDGNFNKYTLTDEDCIGAAYTVMQKSASGTFIPKLFYNSIFTDVSSFPVDGSVPLKPNYGTVSDPLYKKVVICDGDSICKGVQDKPYTWGSWFGRLLRGHQISGKNYGVNGGTIMDKTDTTVGGNPRHSVCLTIDTIHSEYPTLDYLILEGGTNDADLVGSFSGDTPPANFGTWSETDFSGTYDETTFCGGVEYLFYRAVTYYPHAKIGFIIAMEMGTNSSTIANRRRYFDEIAKIAEKWHIPVLDLWKASHADARLSAYYDNSKTGDENVTAKKFYYDGQHPTSYGYNMMQPIIEAWLRTL